MRFNSRPIVGVWALAMILLALPASLRAQMPEPKTIFTNKHFFQMPVKIDDQVRADLKEVCLYVKRGTADWVRQETAQPSVKQFTYRVPQDGEYCFSVATIDRAGRMNPPDIAAQPPGLRVVVDTNAPMVELKPVTGPDGEPCIECSLQDANPDMQSIQVKYRGRDGSERTLEPHPSRPGLFHVSDPNFWGNLAYVSGADRCGNRVNREIQMSGGPAAADVIQTVRNSPPPRQQPSIQENTQPVNFGEEPQLRRAPPASGSGPTMNSAAEPQIEQVPRKLPVKAGSDAAPSNRLILNTQQASLDYRIDQVGSSGVGRVEVYTTTDNGNSWRKLCEDRDRRSPAELDLPGEGTFGIRLVVANGLGFGGGAPTRGDTPTSWIEVDTTPPMVQLSAVEPIAGENGGHLEIHWKASDKNLGNDGVSLSYRTRPDGPWKIIARNLKNDGSYRWAFPHDMGSKFYFKVEAADQAGNSAFAESHNPVLLDLTEPRATVLSVTAVTGRK